MVSSTAIIEQPSSIGDNTFIGHFVVIRPGTRIGRNSKVGHHCVFEGNLSVGDLVSIQPFCVFGKGMQIEDMVFIGPHFSMANDKRLSWLRDSNWQEGKNGIVTLCRACRIGVNVTILPGLTVGENAVVGGGSVVTHDVPPRTIVYGNPAHIHGTVPNEDCL